MILALLIFIIITNIAQGANEDSFKTESLQVLHYDFNLKFGLSPNKEASLAQLKTHNTVTLLLPYFDGSAQEWQSHLPNDHASAMIDFAHSKYVSDLTLPLDNKNKKDFIMDLWRVLRTVCFGQSKDIQAILLALKLINESHPNAQINLFGFSQGGGALINALAALAQKDKNPHVRAVQLTSEKCEQIASKIQNAIASSPLLNVGRATRLFITDVMQGLCAYKKLSRLRKCIHFFSKCLGILFEKFMFPLFSPYKPWREQAGKPPKEIATFGTKLHVIFNPTDPIVGYDEKEIEYFKTFALTTEASSEFHIHSKELLAEKPS